MQRTGSDRDYSIEEESNLCDRPVTKTMMAGDGPDSLDPNDKEYWPTVSRLTRQAFLLDDDSLSDSNYPDVVKNIVRTSRLTTRGVIYATGSLGTCLWNPKIRPTQVPAHVQIKDPYKYQESRCRCLVCCLCTHQGTHVHLHVCRHHCNKAVKCIIQIYTRN